MAKKTPQKKFILYPEFYTPGPNEVNIATIKPESFARFAEALYTLPDQTKFYLYGTKITQRVSTNAIVEFDFTGLFTVKGFLKEGFLGIRSPGGLLRSLAQLSYPTSQLYKHNFVDKTKKPSNIEVFRDRISGRLSFVNAYFKLEFEEYTPSVVLSAPPLDGLTLLFTVHWKEYFERLQIAKLPYLDLSIFNNMLYIYDDSKRFLIDDTVNKITKFPVNDTVVRTYTLNPLELIAPINFSIYSNGTAFIKQQKYILAQDSPNNVLISATLYEYMSEV